MTTTVSNQIDNIIKPQVNIEPEHSTKKLEKEVKYIKKELRDINNKLDMICTTISQLNWRNERSNEKISCIPNDICLLMKEMIEIERSRSQCDKKL